VGPTPVAKTPRTWLPRTLESILESGLTSVPASAHRPRRSQRARRPVENSRNPRATIRQLLIIVGGLRVVAGSACGGCYRPEPAYEWHLPPGFPPGRLVPADNPMSLGQARVGIGVLSLRNAYLSSTGRTACASCHRSDLSIHTDGRSRAIGANRREPVKRGAMSLTNVAYNPHLLGAMPECTPSKRRCAYLVQ